MPPSAPMLCWSAERCGGEVPAQAAKKPQVARSIAVRVERARNAIGSSFGVVPSDFFGILRAVLDELPPEAALDAQMAARHVVVEGRGHAHDGVVLHAELERAADAAVGADCIGHGLLRLVPAAGLPEVMLGLEHEGARRADADAVAAVDAGRLGKGSRELSRNARVEAASGDGDGEGVLRLDTPGRHAL